MQLKKVVLPAPFGPMMLAIAPVGNMKVEAVDGDQTLEALGHAFRFQNSARTALVFFRHDCLRARSLFRRRQLAFDARTMLVRNDL